MSSYCVKDHNWQVSDLVIGTTYFFCSILILMSAYLLFRLFRQQKKALQLISICSIILVSNVSIMLYVKFDRTFC